MSVNIGFMVSLKVKIGYVVEADFFEKTELSMEPGILVLTGLNATMKSIAARTFLLMGIEAD